MTLQFDSFENDYVRVMTIETAKDPKVGGESDFAAGARIQRAYRRTIDTLFAEYLEKRRYDELIDYFADQFDSDNGDEYFIPLGAKLIEEHDSPRFLRLWRKVLANRKYIGNKLVIEKTMRHMLEGFDQLGDVRRSDQIRSELELFLAGKKPKLSKPQAIEMDETYFWRVLAEVKDGSPEAQEWVEFLEQRLLALTAKAIKNFAAIYYKSLNSLYTWDLWGVAYLTFGGCSDDKFEYFRNWIILEGKDTFAMALQNPDSLLDAGVVPHTTEGLPSAFEEAYAARSSRTLKLKVELPGSPQGDPWEEADLASRFPRTHNKILLKA